MTSHAILWCGFAKPHAQHDEFGGTLDFAASLHDLELICKAARKLGIEAGNIHAFVCRDDLLPVDFRGRRYTATRMDLSNLLRALPPDDSLFFAATNHGTREGLLTDEVLDEFDESASVQPLSPQELGLALAGRGGAQVLAIAACYAGTFLGLASENRTVIAACGDDEKYYTGGERPCSPLLKELLAAWAGTTFDDLPPPERCPDLRAAFEAAKTRLTSDYPGRRIPMPQLSGEAAWPMPR